MVHLAHLTNLQRMIVRNLMWMTKVSKACLTWLAPSSLTIRSCLIKKLTSSKSPRKKTLSLQNIWWPRERSKEAMQERGECELRCKEVHQCRRQVDRISHPTWHQVEIQKIIWHFSKQKKRDEIRLWEPTKTSQKQQADCKIEGTLEQFWITDKQFGVSRFNI